MSASVSSSSFLFLSLKNKMSQEEQLDEDRNVYTDLPFLIMAQTLQYALTEEWGSSTLLELWLQ